MRVIWLAMITCGLAAMLALPARAQSYGGNCVLYARAVTGVSLEGNAGAWWAHADGRYRRGSEPVVGAVLVFKPTGHMSSGHVAVVSRVVNHREILVDQANWIRGRVVRNMSVIDASPDNDWTSVRVLEIYSGTHGRENPTYGFIYPNGSPRGDDDRVVTAAAQERPLPVRLASARSDDRIEQTPLASLAKPHPTAHETDEDETAAPIHHHAHQREAALAPPHKPEVPQTVAAKHALHREAATPHRTDAAPAAASHAHRDTAKPHKPDATQTADASPAHKRPHHTESR